MRQDSKRRHSGPQPSVPDPRRHLLDAVLAFVRAARSSPGVRRIALLGSLTTDKRVPKDADVLVTIDAEMDLESLARLGRRLKGAGQRINLGADVFLADAANHYLGRVCHYRECHARVLCRAQHCGRRQHLNDDLQIVTLSPEIMSAPPIELWPCIVVRCAVPADTQALLVAELEKEGAPRA
jgi:predicted nucleotidyltransferase